ncbi:PAS domain S-box protein [Kolteria novifilia]|uniref:PAS domain S-box protein n=1 Tax=Kolteria novifilia TaxID=2527975 RepID=UPI003AF3F79D
MQQHQEVLHAILREMNDGIFIVDPVDLRILEANPMAQRMSGWRKRELRQHALTELIEPESPARTHRLLHAARTTTIFHSREGYLLRRAHDEPLLVNVSISRIHTDPSPLCLVIIRDVSERRHLELTLRDKERFINHVANATPYMMYVFDTIERRNIYANQQCCTFFGYSQEELQSFGSSFFERVVHPYDYPYVEQLLGRHRHALDDEVIEGEYRVRHASGSWRWIRARDVVFVRDDDGAPRQTLGTAVDITDQKEGEVSLLRTQFAVDHAADAIFWTEQSGRLAYANNAACSSLGYSRQELLSLHIGDIDPSFAGDGWPQHWEAIKRDPVHVFESSYRTRSGQRIPVEVQSNFLDFRGQPLVCSFVRDISDRRWAEQQLRTSQEQLTLALDASNVGLWDWNLETDRFYFSDQWYRILQYEPGELPMEYGTWEKLVHPEDLPAATETLRENLEGRAPDYSVEIRMKSKSGAWQWMLTRARVIETDEEGHARRIAGVHLSIDSLKRHEEALRHAKEQAEAANRAKSEFLANMSHEIRTPMTAILGFADIVLQEARIEGVSPTWLDALDTIKRNGEHLVQIINDILDLSKIEAGRLSVDRSAIPLRRFIDEVVSMMRIRADTKGLRLTTEYQGAVPAVVESDATRLRQILINLLSNAVKFTDAGSVVLRVSLTDKEMIRFDVADTGIGLTPQQQVSIFSPFSQADASTSRRFGGTGLGLTICQRLTTLLQGTITVESKPGSGSTFSVEIPAGRLDGVPLLEDSLAGGHVAGGHLADEQKKPISYRILLAEDGPDNRRLISFHLRKAGAKVILAHDGQAAVEASLAARAAGEPFDVILMDMQMPILDGYQATRVLRANGIREPIIALTAHAMAGDREKCENAGCDDYLSKPIDHRELSRVIKQHYRRYHGGPNCSGSPPVT